MYRRKEESPTPQKEFENIKIIRPKKKRLNKKFLVLYIVGFVFLIWASYSIISKSVEYNQKREKLAGIKHQIEILEIKNDYYDTVKNYKGDDLNEYIEKIAREDLDYVKNGERVFVNISGD